MNTKEPEKIQRLLNELQKSDFHNFPQKRKILNVSSKQGVYIIYNFNKEVLHIGRTYRGSQGLKQRLKNHLYRSSSFMQNYSEVTPEILRSTCKFKCIEVENFRERAYLESLAVGSLCPKYIGSNDKKSKHKIKNK
ncbi:MAG: hypothetical protein JST15_07860 [Bacteroidetes bacterium]|nr:hypothetical protein [Bacteroidota bacterium]